MVHEKPINSGGLPKKGGPVCRFKGGGLASRGGSIFERVANSPMYGISNT